MNNCTNYNVVKVLQICMIDEAVVTNTRASFGTLDRPAYNGVLIQLLMTLSVPFGRVVSAYHDNWITWGTSRIDIPWILSCFLCFLAATKQLYEWYFLSVCPSVRLSVRLSVCLSVRLSVCPSVTPFWLCSHHRNIMKFSGVITLDQGKVHAKGQGQRSKVKVTEVTTQIFVSGL